MVVDSKWFEEQIKKLESLDEKYSVSIELTVENKKHDSVDVKKGIGYYDIDSFKCNINSRPRRDLSYITICIIAVGATLIMGMVLCLGRVSYYRADLNLVNKIEREKSVVENKEVNQKATEKD